MRTYSIRLPGAGEVRSEKVGKVGKVLKVLKVPIVPILNKNGLSRPGESVVCLVIAEVVAPVRRGDHLLL